MSCEARNLLNYENSIKLPSLQNLNINDTGHNDIKLNLQLLYKHFEVNTLDETLAQRRNEFQTRTEHLQKRKDALHQKETILKERIISYEMYIKELAMKRERSLRRIDDEKSFIEKKQVEIDLLKKEIAAMQDENVHLQQIILKYQPHSNLLTQIVDQTDRFHSIDELIEKFDMLYASYQDILITVGNSNEELNDAQRELLLTSERKGNRISLMNTRIHELQQNQLDSQQRMQKIQTEIGNYQQMSIERSTEIGAIKIAIESMFDLVQRYNHRNRRKDLNLNEDSFGKLKQIDIFLSDLIYYVDYVNNKQSRVVQSQHSTSDNNRKFKQGDILDQITDGVDDNNRWRGPCEIDRRQALVKTIDKDGQPPYFSYQIRGEDNKLYTIQINTMNKTIKSQARNSLLLNKSSSSSVASRSQEKKSSLFDIQRSLETQPRSSTSRSTRKSLKLTNQQHHNERMPFSDSELTDQTSRLTNRR